MAGFRLHRQISFMKKLSLLLLSLVITGMHLIAQQSPVFVAAGKAIRGYDPVAFFTESKPVAGSDSFTYVWQEATWYFASASNRDMFKQNPEKFAPQYGGYCAYGMSDGHKAPTATDTWAILDGKLYFNYNKKVQELFNKDPKGRIEKANVFWPQIKNKE